MNKLQVQARDVFLAAIELRPEEERAAFVKKECGGDRELEMAVRRLLASHQELGPFQPREESGSRLRQIASFDSDFAPVGTQIGPYTLRELIGEGGMGEVYVAEQTEPVRRKVALKIIRPGMATKDVVARFEAERQALALMEHPHIARVFDGGATETGQPYFVMELVQGRSITEYCDEHRLSTHQRLELFVQVCQAVQHAHQKGIVHRDLKPANVLVPEIDGAPVPKVIDFGIAKATEQKLTEKTIYTQFTKMIGTPLYMSPEQAGLGVVDVDTRSDVYSLGVLLYELLTGTTPFDRETLKSAPLDERLRIIREQEPRRPSATVGTLAAADLTTVAERRGTEPRKLAAALRGELDWIAMRCLDKDRNRRYASAAALAEDVQRFLADEPVTARPASPLYRARKFVTRNRGLVIAVTAVFSALSIGLVLAERRLAQVEHEQRGNEILIGLLNQIYTAPQEARLRGQDYTVGESLAAISAGLKERLRGHPDKEIRVRKILAASLRSWREPEKARAELLRALEVAKDYYGPRDVEVAHIMNSIAYEFDFETGERPNNFPVEEYAEQALEIYRATGEKSFALVTALYAASAPLGMDPRCRDERESLRYEALQTFRAIDDGRHDGLKAYTLSDYAYTIAERRDGRTDEALSLIHEAIDVARGIDDNKGLQDMLRTNEADILHYGGRREEALACHRNAWAKYQESGLADELPQHRAGIRYAVMLLSLNRHREGERILDQIEQLCRERDLYASLAAAKWARAWGRMRREDDVEAMRLCREILAMSKQGLLSPQHQMVAFAQGHLARLRAKSGDMEAARAIFAEFLPLVQGYAAEEVFDPTANYGVVVALTALGGRERLLQAVRLTDEYIDAERIEPHWGREAHFHLWKAKALRGLGRIKEAQATLEAGLNRHVFTTYPEMHRGLPTTRHELELELVDMHLAASDRDAAIAVMKDGVEVRWARVPMDAAPGDLLPFGLATLRLAELHLRLDEFSAAESQFQVAWDLLAENPEAADDNRRRVAAGLERLYTACGKSDRAAHWRSERMRIDRTWERVARRLGGTLHLAVEQVLDQWLPPPRATAVTGASTLPSIRTL